MNSTNPRLKILKREIEQQIVKPLHSHGWNASIIAEHDRFSSVELEATKNEITSRFAFIYSTATDKNHYKQLANNNECIFYSGQAYKIEDYARDIDVPILPMGDFFLILVKLNKQIEPDQSPSSARIKAKKNIKRLTDENPQQAILLRLEQFKSIKQCERLILRRYESQGLEISKDLLLQKSEGVAYSIRSALDYFHNNSTASLNRRILGLYYGAMSFAFAEMLASPHGPNDLDEVEGITKQGHGLYTVLGAGHTIADLHVGVLATGFLPRWLSFLGHDIENFPRKKARSLSDFDQLPTQSFCTFGHLLGSFQELEDLYHEVFDTEPSWVIPVHSTFENRQPSLNASNETPESTYCKFIDYSGKIQAKRLVESGLPIAEITSIEKEKWEHKGHAYRVRVDHQNYKYWHDVIPTHNSPINHRSTVLLPTMGGLSEYRVLATAALYVLSIAVRYMPSVWRQVEGGETDEYLAIIKSAVTVWERVLPHQFLESIADETVRASQPGSWLS